MDSYLQVWAIVTVIVGKDIVQDRPCFRWQNSGKGRFISIRVRRTAYC